MPPTEWPCGKPCKGGVFWANSGTSLELDAAGEVTPLVADAGGGAAAPGLLATAEGPPVAGVVEDDRGRNVGINAASEDDEDASLCAPSLASPLLLIVLSSARLEPVGDVVGSRVPDTVLLLRETMRLTGVFSPVRWEPPLPPAYCLMNAKRSAGVCAGPVVGSATLHNM